MKTLIIYDSVFGNTSKIAHAIFQGIPDNANVRCVHVSAVSPQMLHKTDLLIVGSPTRGFRPTPAIAAFLKNIGRGELKNVQAAAFDTRLSLPEINSRALKFIVRTGGYAATRISRMLASRGASVMLQPEGFFVSGEEGPLLDQEMQRANEWGFVAYTHTEVSIPVE
ncbi:MAG: flavodoxin domain-containing protein [Bacteroidales bacterium]|nr:flavodoxin domain-containing protein [Bacteroidales bacterium]